MTRSSKKWRKLSAGEFQSFWETPKDKDGNQNFVLRLRGMFLHFTPKEFSELLDLAKEVENTIFPTKGDFYR